MSSLSIYRSSRLRLAQVAKMLQQDIIRFMTIDRQGIIRFKHVGPVTPQLLQDKLLPLIRELEAS